MNWRKLLISLTLGVSLSACQTLGWNQSDEPLVDQNTLAALQPATIMPSSVKAEVPVGDVISRYTHLLPLLVEPEEKIRILHRLADLKLAKGEVLLAEQAVDELDIAISAYEGLLEKYPDRSQNDQVLYNLAKSYDLKGLAGQQLATLDQLIEEHPNSSFITEVQFRRGEILFTNGDYFGSQAAFEAVIAQGDSVFLANAYYMKGWSQFKLGNYETALFSYVKVLDLTLRFTDDETNIDERNRTMVEDLFRVMSLSFSYLGGADGVESLFAMTGPRDYEILVYDRYSDLLLSKERYSDAIEVYQRYIALHPLSKWAPQYQIKVIETLRIAGFIRDIQAEKERFVSEYRKGSVYWDEHDGKDLSFVKAQLETLLPELGNRSFVKAQKLKGKAFGKNANAEKAALFEEAADYYTAFVDTFPEHAQTAEMVYLLGESRNLLAQWEPAIDAYEQAAYNYPGYEKAVDAGYAAIVMYKNYVGTLPQQPADTYLQAKASQQANRLRFVEAFPGDQRAPDVLYIATRYAFDQKEYANTIQLAEQLLAWQPAPDQARSLETNLLIAHSYYELKDYVYAEPVYQLVVEQMPKKDKRRENLIEKLAATVFNQAEAKLAAGDKAGAIEQFLRVGLVAPTAKLRASAEYDAANYLIELKDWNRAIQVMTDFRNRYPKHPDLATLPPKLALSYRETSQWELAAKELYSMYENAKTEQEKQDTLYLVAELYDRAKNKEQAILSYRKYANTYPEPADIYMETANRLAELYKETNQAYKRSFWMAKQMKTVDRLGDKATDRMRYLAASAAAEIAANEFYQYKRIKLTLPLNETMVKKTEALEKAMKAYQKTASYGISEFSTEAGYRMADIYAKLSEDLMESERPPGLSELELEQYEILLEEQAYPFEDNAIEIHEQNASRSWLGIYDNWVKQSYDSLKTLLPGRYNKPELLDEVVYEVD